MMKEKGTWLVPTLTSISSVLKDPDYLEKLPKEMIRQTEEIVEEHRDSIERAYKAGVRIAMGTDSGVMDHGQNLRELESMCNIGMTPMESIMASTKDAAECLEWDKDLGTLEPGKLADIVITSINPLEDIRSLQSRDNITLVMKNGRVMKDIRTGNKNMIRFPYEKKLPQ
jgi:imidazolonepropionase-like amidohydrolase